MVVVAAATVEVDTEDVVVGTIDGMTVGMIDGMTVGMIDGMIDGMIMIVGTATKFFVRTATRFLTHFLGYFSTIIAMKNETCDFSFKRCVRCVHTNNIKSDLFK